MGVLGFGEQLQKWKISVPSSNTHLEEPLHVPIMLRKQPFIGNSFSTPSNVDKLGKLANVVDDPGKRVLDLSVA